MFEIGATVQVKDAEGTWTIVGMRDAEPRWNVRRGLDAATQMWKRTEDLELVAEAPKRDPAPGIYPARGIMD